MNEHIRQLNEYTGKSTTTFSLKKFEHIKNIEAEVEKRWYEYLAKENEAKIVLKRKLKQKEKHEEELQTLKSEIKVKNEDALVIIRLANEEFQKS